MGAFNLVLLLCYLAIIALSLFLYIKRDKTSNSQIKISSITYNRILTIILPVLLILIGCTLRLYQLTGIPAGLHQDEASIGYESFILSEFGMDRDGYRYPVYPITYGSGGGSPLMIYLNVLTTSIFGSNVLTLRALPAILGCITLIVVFLLIKNLSRESIRKSSSATSLQYVTGEYIWLPLVSLCIIAFSPWHIMLSRWSLDSNTTPFWVFLAMLVFVLASKNKKASTMLYGISAFLYALTLYSYGAATIVIPLHLILMCIIFTKSRKMTGFQVIVGIVVFILFTLPLIAFYVVNFLDLPEVVTPYFSITKFTSSRSVFASGSGFFLMIWKNLLSIIKNLSVGNSSEQMLNYIPGFPPFYAFTFPMTLTGIVISIVRSKRGELIDLVMNSLAAPALLFGIFVEEDITRMVLIFIPIIYYLARGFIFVVGEFVTIEKNTTSGVKQSFAIVAKSLTPFLFIAATILFSRIYFEKFNELSAESYMPGYGEACVYAEKSIGFGGHVYSTYEHVSAPFMVALYYTKTPPKDFLLTVHYKDPDAEFRIADSFTHFKFGLPDDIDSKGTDYLDKGDVFILHKSQLYLIDLAAPTESKAFGNFVVVYR